MNNGVVEEGSFKKEDVDYAQILRWQLNRIGMAGVMKSEPSAVTKGYTPEDFVEMSVNILDAYLYPYADQMFDKLKDSVTDRGAINSLDLLRCCVDLMHRKGLLLKETITVNEG